MKNSVHYEMALKEADLSTFDGAYVLELLDRAAAEGDDRAIYARAQCFRYGTFGSKVDPKVAYGLNCTLEKSNIAEAVFNLAYDYDIGNFVRKNLKRAFSLYMTAALLGDTESCAQISQFYRLGYVVSQNRSLAKAWKERSKCDEKLISPPYRRWLR
jgi:uncharacterized protein